MADMASVISVWANYPREDNGAYERLLAITSWTEEDFLCEAIAKERFEKNHLKPDFTIRSFTEVLDIIDQPEY